MGFIKGASAHWWNHLHNQHHAKPNVVRTLYKNKIIKLCTINFMLDWKRS
jgi:hypothetical protein